MKESFVIYKSFYEPIKFLPNEQLGELFRAIFEYQIDGFDEEINPEIKMAFEFFKNQFRIDEEKYQKVVERNRANGRNGGRPEKPKKPSGLKENPKNPSEPKKADNDNENENVKENDNDNVAKAIIDSLNLKAGKKFRHTRTNLDCVIPRLKDGFTKDDCLYVIDVKVNEWLGGEMEKHLNPETLFRPKNFEKYLNQKSSRVAETDPFGFGVSNA